MNIEHVISSAYTNKEINAKKIMKPIRDFQLSLGGGGEHLLELTTFSSAHMLYLIPDLIYILGCY